jgi:hypothetical protein
MLKRLLHHSKKENRAGMNILIANCLFILVAGSINKTFAESGFQTPKDADTSRSSRVLVEKFTSAHKSRNLDSMMSLVHWKGVTPETRASLRKSFERIAATEIKSVYVSKSIQGLTTEYVRASVRYRINLEPVGLLTIQLKSPENGVNSTSYCVGKYASDYLIATAAPVE